MKDRYDFMTIVDEIFKECTSVEDIVARYVQMGEDFDKVFCDNVALRAYEGEDTE